MNPRSYLALFLATLLLVPALTACTDQEEWPEPIPLGFDESDLPNSQQPDTNQEEQNQPEPQENQNQGEENQNQQQPLPTDGYDGDPCTGDTDCRSGICIPSPDWPNGYCTTLDCASRTDCQSANDENACLQNPQGSNFCIRLCDPNQNNACRSGYQCQPVRGGQGWCAPSPGNPSEVSGEFPFTLQCQDVSGTTLDIPFSVAANTNSYMMVPFTGNGGWLDPVNITTPSGGLINFRQANSFQAAGAQLFGSINPTVVPAAPQFAGQLATGNHIYRLNTQDSEMCYYLLQSTGTPTTIDLNIYLVGLSGINANNAATNGNMQQTMNFVEDILGDANISLGTVRYFSVPTDVEEAYSTVRSQAEVGTLLSYTQYPGATEDAALSANIAITQRFRFGGGGGVLGLSQGIPGAAGLHGTFVSGVALTGEYMGYQLSGGVSGNYFTATTLAHELGHFLGLFHTSETTGQHFDPLNDTPQCTDFSQPWTCPDWGNLMFPMADTTNDSLTSDQSYVIRVNPLTK